MELLEAIAQRHAVRAFEDRQIEKEIKEELEGLVKKCNGQSGLHIQLVTDEPKAFDSFMAHYGKFQGVKNYLALIGKNESSLDEKCGYYGQKIVLRAQQLGLNSCWVGLTYGKTKDVLKIDKGEKLRLVVALGYGKTKGVQHKSKKPEDVMRITGNASANQVPSDGTHTITTPAGAVPEWFMKGVQAALLAPTALNQQKFTFTLDGNKVSAKAGFGSFSKVDLGIAKYHFEIGAGVENFTWVK